MATRIEVLAGEIDALRAEIVELDALEEPTEEETARFAAALSEWDEKKAEHGKLVERAEKVAAVRDAASNATVSNGFNAGGPQVMLKKDPFEDLASVRFMIDPELRHARQASDDMVARAVTAVTDNRRGASDDQVQAAVEKIESTPGIAQHALMFGSPQYRAAFGEWFTGQGRVPFPVEDETVRTALSLTGADGGYTLPTLLDPTLIHTGAISKDPLRSISRVVAGTQNVWHGVSAGNVTTYWVGEATTATEGSPTFSNPSVTAAKLMAYIAGSYEIFEDSNLASQLPGLIGEAFSSAEQAKFVLGTGTGEPNGIAVAVTSGTAVTLTTASTLGYVDLQALHDAIPSRYENSSTWVANKTRYTTIRGFATGSYGSLFWANLGQNTPPLLVDSPYIKASDMTTATTTGSVVMIYGDFSQFLIYDRVGVSIEYIQNVVDGSGVPTGQRGYVAHKRVGSDVTDINAFAYLKGK